LTLTVETEAEFAAALDQAIQTPGVCVQVPAEVAVVFGLDDHGPESAEAADVEGLSVARPGGRGLRLLRPRERLALRCEHEHDDLRHVGDCPRSGTSRPGPGSRRGGDGTIGGAISSTDTVTRADLDAATAALRADLAELETRLTRTLYAVAAALLAGQLGAVFALLRLLG